MTLFSTVLKQLLYALLLASLSAGPGDAVEEYRIETTLEESTEETTFEETTFEETTYVDTTFEETTEETTFEETTYEETTSEQTTESLEDETQPYGGLMHYGEEISLGHTGVAREDLPLRSSLRVESLLQNPELPTGCESVALTIALKALGFPLEKTTIAAEYLIHDEANFAIGFVGDPFQYGAGVFPPGLVMTANRYLQSQDSQIRAYDCTGFSFEEVLSYLSEGNPVLIWVTIGFGEPSYAGYAATFEDRTYEWYYGEHCVALKGYDLETGTVVIEDPLQGEVTYGYDFVKGLYEGLGAYALVLTGDAIEVEGLKTWEEGTIETTEAPFIPTTVEAAVETTTEEVPVSTEEAFVTTEEAPVSTEETPATTEESPATTEDDRLTYWLSGQELPSSTSLEVIRQELPLVRRLPLTPLYQNPELPCASELVALTIALKGLGLSLEKTTIASQYLYTDPSNFAIGFVGNPFGEGMGIFPPGLVMTANRYLMEEGSEIRAYDCTGFSFEELMQYVADYSPVLIWVSEGMGEIVPADLWAVFEDRSYEWYYTEHCVAIKGYDRMDASVTVEDPMLGEVSYPYERVKGTYERCGLHAVVLR